jgi:uncharacterized Ntn-hydrolase superfamily protein
MTFSILGLCRRTGRYGVALATSSIGAGARCPFVKPGVGVVVTQARTDPRLGPVGLELLESGLGAGLVVRRVVETTPDMEWRQFAALDPSGNAAFHSGASVGQPADGMVVSDGVVVGNWVTSEAVIAAMAAGFELNPGDDLADRLLQSIEAGLDEGGEKDPLQSAALIIADPAVPFPVIDLRIDLSATPISDLRMAWERWAPLADGYVQRALDPGAAPDTRTLEGHA